MKQHLPYLNFSDAVKKIHKNRKGKLEKHCQKNTSCKIHAEGFGKKYRNTCKSSNYNNVLNELLKGPVWNTAVFGLH